MAETDPTTSTPASSPEATTPAGGDDALEAGNYEVIRARLVEQGKRLQTKAEALNEKRKETFGGTELSVIATERIRTENNCVPRDIVQVGGLLLLGYNVFIGLKSETKVSDVFALHKFEPRDDGTFDCSDVGLSAAHGFLQDASFIKNFESLYKYTREARLLQLVKRETKLLGVFQVGSNHTDIKAFRWRIEPSGRLAYEDDRGDRDYTYPPSHEFEWTEPGPEATVEGQHINLENKVFVSNVGGRLSLRVEDNTDTGREVYREDLEDENQVLIDLGLKYAVVGPLVLLAVTPFREATTRYIVFNTKTETGTRIDAIGLACQELPEDHGIIFPGGYYLESGDHKVFESERVDGLEFKRKVSSPNGEDVLYLYHRRADGHYVLFPYNLIRKEVQTPIHCHGYCMFDDGRMVVFRAASDEPTRVHPMQVWQTPFTSAAFAAAAPTDGSYLANVGNAELVRGISDAFSVARLIRNAEPTRQIFEDLVATTARCLDGYYWLGHDEAGDLESVLREIRGTADLIIDEFEKVVQFKQQARAARVAIGDEFVALTRDLRPEHFKRVEPFLGALTSLRGLRGKIITLRDMRYMDLTALRELEDRTVERFDEVSQACVRFLLQDAAFAPLTQDIESTLGRLDEVAKVADVVPLKEKVDETAEGLDLLSEVVANLEIEDATQRTHILEGIGEVFGQLNRVRATIEGRRKELMSEEGKAEFGAQFALLGQSVSSALAVADTPEKCDDQLGRLMVQLEELEGRFSEFDEFLGDLAQKREEIYDAFSARKQQLNDERQRRIQNIASAVGRILEGVGRRSRQMGEQDELNAYFASDGMVMKARSLCEQLVTLGDSVKADAFLAQLASARQDALRGLRDKQELFVEGEGIIKLGRHRFNVNTQALELAMVPRDGEMMIHLNGTDYYAGILDEGFQATRRFWSQSLVSENDEVYRGEYLAACILDDAEHGRDGLTLGQLRERSREGTLVEVTRRYAQNRYDEGYDRGLHDADAAAILDKMLALREAAGLLRYAPPARALGALFWGWYETQPDVDADAALGRWALRARNLGRLRQSFDGPLGALRDLALELQVAVEAFVVAMDFEEVFVDVAPVTAEYLVEELLEADLRFVTTATAERLRDDLLRYVDLHGDRMAFDTDFRALEDRLRERFGLARAWVEAYLDHHPELHPQRHLSLEVAAMLCDRKVERRTSAAVVDAEATGLLGQHPRIEDGKMRLRIDELSARLDHFRLHEVPAYRAYREQRHSVLDAERQALRLEEFTPKVMSAFVRNKLINDVYLPLIGDNLAKQIGAAGEGKRTDLMGLLLLISPPGYGKTTLMEYIANRLGLVFVKVNGPSLGHSVVSLDPSEAPNATARQEVEKINLAFEMGNNVMLYLDDIQHTHPELLQKFISLCDAQRRIEGVWRGRTRTYDMRGRKFCVVMAGNPYTESGDKFTIPDMLANRADTYNLGDILEGRDEAFALSYIENALTSNPVLQPLSTRSQADVYKLIDKAQGEEVATTDLEHGYSGAEVEEIVAVLRHMETAQKTLLLVNQQYIASAAQDDRFRTEPPFKLQGSYRNMNRLAEKIVSAMTTEEVEALVDDHYRGESQTLTTGAEQNLLKLAEMRGRLTEADATRWKELKEEYVRHLRMGGRADDPVARLTGTLSGLSADLTGIRDVIADGTNKGLDAAIDRAVGALVKEVEGVNATLAEGTNRGLDAKVDAVGTGVAGIAEALGQALTLMAEAEAQRREVATKELDLLAERGAIEAARRDTEAQHYASEQARHAAAAQRRRAEEKEAEAKRPIPRPDGDRYADLDDNPRVGRAERLAGAEKWMKPYLLRIEAALEALGRPKVEVQTTTPHEVQLLLKQQMYLIEHTLVPLVTRTAQSHEESRALLQTLQEVRERIAKVRPG
ncbi:MAG: DNA repair ATPase [Myxococcota bacterium]